MNCMIQTVPLPFLFAFCLMKMSNSGVVVNQNTQLIYFGSHQTGSFLTLYIQQKPLHPLTSKGCIPHQQHPACQPAAPPPQGRRWQWYPPWRQGWYTSWWVLAASLTWPQCPRQTWLCRRPHPALQGTEKGKLRVTGREQWAHMRGRWCERDVRGCTGGVIKQRQGITAYGRERCGLNAAIRSITNSFHYHITVIISVIQ